MTKSYPLAVVTALALAFAGCASNSPRFVYFADGADQPRTEGDAEQTGGAAETLRHEPEWRAAIIGYASSEGTPADNRALSFRRAAHVRDLIASRGVAPDRLTVAARGSEFPAAKNDTAEGRSLNRRVEVFFYDPRQGELQVQYGTRIELQTR